MNGRAAKLIRRMFDGSKTEKRRWKNLSHTQRGELREEFKHKHGRVQEPG